MNESDYISLKVRERIGYYIQWVYGHLLQSRTKYYLLVEFTFWLIEDLAPF